MIYVYLIVGLALLLLVLVWWKQRKRGLTKGQKKQLERLWRGVLEIEDPLRRVIEADSVLDKALTMLGFTGSTGEKLKAATPRLKDRNAVWEAHKLRNRIAHEAGLKLNEKQADAAVRALERGWRSL